MIKPLILAFVAFVIFLLIHSTYFHFRRPSQRARSVFITYVACAAFYLLLWLLTPGESAWSTIIQAEGEAVSFPDSYAMVACFAGVLLYTLLFVGYLEFYFTADRSVAFMILVQVEKTGGSGASIEGLSSMLDMHAYFRRRFDDLVYGGYLRKNDSLYFNTPKGHMFARLYASIIRYLHLQER